MQRPRDGRMYQGRLGKHVPVGKQQNLNNATARLQQWKTCAFYVVRAEML
jgi:hypothetical protein